MGRRQASLHEQLEAQAARLRTQLSELTRNSRPTGIGQRPVAGGDVVDQAAAHANREQARARVRMLAQRLEETEAALDRLAAGTYGTCRVCGGAISPDRLEVLPTTTLCVADREGLDRGADRPATLSSSGGTERTLA